MRRVGIAFSAASLLALASPALAQSPGPFTGARVLPPEARRCGGYLVSSDHELGGIAQLRLSFYPGVDFGFQGGLVRYDLPPSDPTVVRVGADARFALASAPASTLDVTIGAGIGIESGDDFNVLSIGPTIAIGHEFLAGAGGAISPYVSAGLSIERVNVGARDLTDTSLPVRIGSEIRLVSYLTFVAELQVHLDDALRDDLGVAIGATMEF